MKKEPLADIKERLRHEKCPACKGAGKTKDGKCQRCNGTGMKAYTPVKPIKKA